MALLLNCLAAQLDRLTIVGGSLQASCVVIQTRCMADGYFVLYLLAVDQKNKRSVGRAAHAARRSKFQTYPKELLKVLRSMPGCVDSSGENLIQECKRKQGRIIDVALCKFVQVVADVMQYMTGPLRFQSDFWQEEYNGERQELVQFQIVDLGVLVHPTLFTTGHGHGRVRTGAHTVVCKLSLGSSGRLMQAEVLDRAMHPIGRTQALFERWQATHRIVDADQVPVAGRCLRLPVPWVVLVVAGIWSKANRRVPGYAQMHGNVLDVDPSGCHDDIADVRDIDLTAAQGAADTLRLLANQVDNVSPLLTQEARSHVVWLQALADSFNSFNFRHVGQAFRMMEFVNHVVFVGILRGIGSETTVLHRILMLALKAGLPSRLATHLVDHLNIN